MSEAIIPYPIDDAALVSTNATESVAAWAAGTAYLFEQTARSDTTHRIYKSLIGEAATVTISIGTPGVVTKAAHGYSNGTPVIFATTGALPTGLTAGTTYYLVGATADTFQVAATPAGAAINTSGSQSGVHTATLNPNKGYDPTDPANLTGSSPKWLDVAPTNAWAMFDARNSTQTVRAGDIAVEVDTVGWIDRVAAGNLSATSLRVVAEADGDTVYDETHELIDDSAIVDLWTYFYEPIRYRRDIVLEMPAYPDMSFAVTASAGGGTNPTAVGNLVFGTGLYLGEALKGSRAGLRSYSTVDEDEFGEYVVTPRAKAKRGIFDMIVESARGDMLQEQLGELDSVPLFWNLSEAFTRTQIFGFYGSLEFVFSEHGWNQYELVIKGIP